MKRRTVFFLGLFLLILPVFKAHSYIIVEVNLPTIATESEIAFRGVCRERDVKTIYPESAPNGVVVTYYKFDVKDVIKGDVGKEFEFYQYGVANKQEAAKLGAPFAVGFIEFQMDKEYVVFLSEKSKIGVRSPLGIEQGVFDVLYTDAGKATVVNRFSNKNLFKNLKMNSSMTKALKAGAINASKPPEGPMSYDSFKSFVENLK